MKTLFYTTLVAVLFFTDHILAWPRTCRPAGEIIYKKAGSFSNPTDHFRSVATGSWNVASTWESSPDNVAWSAATLTPTSTANTISIRNTHTVTVNADENMDQVMIENGGILLHASNILTVNDGTGDDIIVQNGGIFTLASNSNGPQFTGSATANINTAGMLRLSASGLTGVAVGVNASNFVYSHASILEYTLIFAFSTAGVTFFPNVNAATIPVFRITANVAPVGANTFTTINGLFEANGNISFQNTGNKTFRNGISGTGNVTGDATCGKFIINGGTAGLGGTGLLTLPPANGMDIGTSTIVTMASNKSVTGNIALLANALIVLGAFNLTMTGNISGGSVTSHVVTNSSGKLFVTNIGAAPVIFPIGANITTISPLAIFNGSNLNYGARVEIGINPPIRFPVAAINRTWVVNASAIPPGPVNVNFFYTNTDGNAVFNYAPATVEQGFYTGVWNVINTGLTQFGGPVNFQVTTLVNTFASNTDAPMVIANIPAILEASNSIQLTAQKQPGKTVLNWAVYDSAAVAAFTVERSADGRTYTALMELMPGNFGFTDGQPLPGLNYYRIKMKSNDGKLTYSNIAVSLNAAKGNELISIVPNPVVSGNFKLNVSAAQKTQMEIVITDMQGRPLRKKKAGMTAGYNTIRMDVGQLATGTYLVYGITADGRSGVLRFVIQ